jgi:dihydrofolate reductase
MRKLINSTYLSLDGVIVNPQDWPASTVPDERGAAIQNDLLFSCDAVLMGRKTYEGFAGVWEGRSGDPYTDRINAMDKYVVSSTLQEPTWNNTQVISADPVSEVARLKAEPGQDIVQYGFGPIAHQLMAAGLLDEVRLWLHPFFVGHGGADHLLYRDTALARFDLVDSTPLNSGILVLSYRIASAS